MHDLCSNDSDERIVVINRLYDDNQEDKNKNKVDKYIFNKKSPSSRRAFTRTTTSKQFAARLQEHSMWVTAKCTFFSRRKSPLGRSTL